LLTGFVVETSGSLTSPNWTPLVASAVTTNSLTSVALSFGAQKQFYRLASPTPKLVVAAAGASRLVVSWPVLSANYQLEESDSLSAPNWTAVSGALVVSNSFNNVQITPSAPRKFFHLRASGP
jgi:hypothetical protein